MSLATVTNTTLVAQAGMGRSVLWWRLSTNTVRTMEIVVIAMVRVR